jgi:hypothetical protein
LSQHLQGAGLLLVPAVAGQRVQQGAVDRMLGQHRADYLRQAAQL